MRPKFDRKVLKKRAQALYKRDVLETKPITEILHEQVVEAQQNRDQTIQQLQNNIQQQISIFKNEFYVNGRVSNLIHNAQSQSPQIYSSYDRQLKQVSENTEKLNLMRQMQIGQCVKCYHLTNMEPQEFIHNIGQIQKVIAHTDTLTERWFDTERDPHPKWQLRPFVEPKRFRIARRYEPADMQLGEFLNFLGAQ